MAVAGAGNMDKGGARAGADNKLLRLRNTVVSHV